MRPTPRSRVVRLAKRRSIVTAADIVRAGIHSQQVTRLVAAGVLERVGRGSYRLATGPMTEHHALAVAASAVPAGVICLLSALTIHQIGSQLPVEVWLAVRRGTRSPALANPPLRIVRFTGAAFTHGIETHRIEGRPVRVYSVAKTLADLFKYRYRIGLEVAIEALRDAWRDRRFTMDALDRAARACRVERVMRPYVEAVVT